MDFLELGLNKQIVEILRNNNYNTPTEVQSKAIPVVLKGSDVIVRSETGSGKTFAFVLPILQKIDAKNDNIQCLIVCPTRELAMQVADECKKIADGLGVKVCAVFGGSNLDRQVKSLKKNPQIVVGTTGRIMDLIKKNALKLHSANFVVLDEADEMLDMGFLPDIEYILKRTQKERQTLLFSATMPEEVQNLAKKYQNNAVLVEIGESNKTVETVNQYYIFADKKYKKQALLELFFCEIFDKAIIFTNTKLFAEELEKLFSKNKLPAKAMHSDIRQNERKRILQSFRDGKISILIATDVASRGLDIKNVEYVVNFDLPHQFEYYMHRIGRTARAGESGTAISIVTSLEQLSQLKDIEKLTKSKILPFETNSENLSQYFVDTKKLAKQKSSFSSKNRDKTFFKNENTDDISFDKNSNRFKKNGNFKFKNNVKTNKISLKNNKTHKSFEEDFAQKQTTFKRFSTFDYFDDFYGGDYDTNKSKKQKNKNLKKLLNNKGTKRLKIYKSNSRKRR